MELRELLIATGSDIKAIGKNRYGGYLVHFNTPDEADLHGERFIPETNFMLKTHPLVGKPVLFNHGLDPSIGVVPMGVIDKAYKDHKGVWAEFAYKFSENYRDYFKELAPFKEWKEEQEDALRQYDAYIRSRLDNGTHKWSGGALPQGVITAEDGTILQWPFNEGSGTFTPAEWRGRTRIMPVKALLPHLKQFSSLQAMYEEEDSADAPMHDAMPEGTPDEATQATPIIGNKMHEGIKMEMEQMIAAIRQLFEEYGLAAPADEEAKAAAEELEDDTMRAMTEEEDEEGQKSVTLERLVRHLDANFDKVAKAVAEVQVNIRAQKAESRKDAFARAQQEAQLDKGQPENSKRNKAGAVHNENGASLGQIKMTDRRYANWTPEDFSFAAMLANKSRFTSNAAPLPIKLDNAFMGAFADAATKAHEQGTVRLSNAAIKGINMIKANELDHSTQVGFGDEWVPELWSDQIWERARQDNVILPLFQTTEMPSNPFVMPVEDADPDVYYVAETTAENQLTLADGNSPIPDSKIGTNNITLTAYKFGTRTGISAEFQEDAVPSSVPMFRRQAERALKDTIDNILVNGDTSSSNNINLDGGSPAANLPYRAFDGLIHNPLVDATSNAIDGTGGAPTLAKIRQARFALQAGSINALSDLVIIVDNATYGKLLGLDEFITMDKAGARATAQTGQIGFIDGIPVLATAEMALSATNGKVSSTGGNNLYGRLLIVDKRFWKVGYRRQITQTLDFIPYYDSWQLTTTVRLAFKNQNNDSTTLLYHLAV